MNKKRKGFSLAELLISLLVISLVLSAAIPTLTKRSSLERESIWRWSTENNSAYFGTGSNQSAIIGYDSTPISSTLLTDIMDDAIASDLKFSYDKDNPDTGVINLGDVSFSNVGDKLIILKKAIQGNNSDLLNSHISFYTMPNSETATTSDIEYAGRLAMDQGNIALGMGALQSIDYDNVGENTAIGHFALMRDTDGIRNTAIGKKALSYNSGGSFNTALGFASLFEIGNGNPMYSSNAINSENTAIGALAMEHKVYGDGNTAVGVKALNKGYTGDYNTVIGYRTLSHLETGDDNIAIGAFGCYNITSGDGNICIGSPGTISQGADDYGLYIGSSIIEQNDDGVVPLITGHTQQTDANDKELIVNARKVEFRPWTGSNPLFVFNSLVGTGDGYDDDRSKDGTSTIGRTGTALFNLRDTGGKLGDNTSVTLDFQAIGGDDTATGALWRTALIYAYDPYNYGGQYSTTNLADIRFNDFLTFDFNTSLVGNNEVDIYTSNPGNSSVKYILSLNSRLKVENSSDAPYLIMSAADGFNLSIDKTNSQGIKITDDDYYISLNNGTNNFYAAPNNLSATVETLNLNATDKGNNITMGNISIGDEDITISGISSHGGSIKDSINELYNLVSGTSSDERLKNISGDNSAGLKEINALEVKNYTYKNDKEKTPHVGVIAQQLQKIFPNSVFEGSDGYLKIKTEEIFYAMVNSIKELFTQIQDLTAKITGLDKRITELEQQNKALIEQNKAFEKRLEKLEKKSAK